MLGKYFAALGIYTVALAFLAFGTMWELRDLGDPDYGFLAANFLGFWLMGAMLIATGMVASILSGNVTVAFILGAVFCAVPVFAKLLGSPTAGAVRQTVEQLSLTDQLRPFGSGVVPLSGIVYFLSLTIGMLYLNMVMLGRRNWAGGPESAKRWTHSLTRIAAVLIGLVSVGVIVQKTMGAWRIDATQERIHSLSPATISMIKKIPPDRPVFIQAYISPEVPREFVQTRRDLIEALNEYAAIGGSRLQVKIFPTETFSPASRDAETRFGIVPRRVGTITDARQTEATITMGLAFSSGLDQVVIPFFDRGLPIEYELTRSIRVVTGTKRRKVGILTTDAALFGETDPQSFSPQGEWTLVTELKKQYDVSQISPDAPIPSDLSALVVAQPSSLTQKQIDSLTAYVRAGGPTLLLMDPFPNVDPSISPSVPKRPSQAAMMGGAPPPEPKGNLQPLLDLIGVEWPSTEIVWNTFNPHKMIRAQPEIIFIARDASRDAFGKDPASQGLEDLVFLAPGELRPVTGSTLEFEPLLRTNDLGGTISYDDIVKQNTMRGMAQPPRYLPGIRSYTIAARIKGALPPPPAPPAEDGKPAPPAVPGAEANVIAIADLDFVTDQFFRLRSGRPEEIQSLNFDNVSFFLNCVDELAGDESFIALRGRRAKHRTLKAIEDQSRQFVLKAEEETKAADDEAVKEIELAQKRLTEQVDAILANKELDARTKETNARFRQQVESKRLDLARAEVEDRKRRRIEDAKIDEEESIQSLRNRVRAWALIRPPLPILLLGGFVFFARARKENTGAAPSRIS